MKLGNNKLINKINDKRQTTKEYSDKAINEKDWEDILSSIYWAPTSHGFEPYRVLVVSKQNTKVRKELKPMMWEQGTIINADKLLFFISLKKDVFMDPKWVIKRAKRRVNEILNLTGEEAEKAAKSHADLVIGTQLKKQENSDDWAMKQTYIALGMAMSAATILNIDSQPIEGFKRKELENYFLENKLIDGNERIALAMSFGYATSSKAFAHFGSGKRIRDPWATKFREI